MSLPDQALWSELHELLRHRHMAPGHDALDSVNRLLRKSERVKETLGSLQLPRGRVSIAVENWELARLVAILHSSQFTDAPPEYETGAVAVVRRDPLDYLIDGRRRINHWKRGGAAGPHRVLVVQEIGQ